MILFKMKNSLVRMLTLAVLATLWAACNYISDYKTAPSSPDTVITAIDTAAVQNDTLAADSIATDSLTAATDTVPHIILSGDSVAYDHGSTFLVVSKKDLRLIVYARSNGGDTIALASYPVCMGKNKGDKQKSGDMRTPESPAGKPFTISMIQDASTWKHDFGDGRGSILAYGQWFLRLEGDYPGNSIGIHGSTGNRYSIPGRGSEGCIRLRDEDIVHLKENYAFKGMNVYIERDK